MRPRALFVRDVWRAGFAGKAAVFVVALILAAGFPDLAYYPLLSG